MNLPVDQGEMKCQNYSYISCSNKSNSSFLKDVPTPIISDWGFWIKFLSTPLIVLVGIIGNSLSLMVMKAPSLRNKSYSHFLCALAVFDTFSLLIRQIESIDEYYVFHSAKPGVFQNFNSLSCKMYNFTAHVITLMSSWLVVLMAVERLIAVCFPFKNAVLRKQNGALIAICVLLGIVLLSQSFRFIIIEHLLYDQKFEIWDCLAGHDFIELYTSLDIYFFQWALVFVLPVVLISVCNSMVIYQILKVKKDVNREEEYLTRADNSGARKKTRSTRMLLILTFTYMLTLLPVFSLTLIVDLSIKFSNISTARNVYLTLTPYIDVGVAISLLNYAVNFFIYVLSGKRFRFELKRLFRRRRRNRPSIKRTATVKSTRV